MSLELLREFKKSGLPTTERFVAMMLADHCNRVTGQCNPSMSLLAEETGLEERSIRRAIKSLETKGFLTIKRLPGGRNDYELHPGHRVTPDTESPRTQSPITPDTESYHPGHRVLSPRTQSPMNNKEQERTTIEQEGEAVFSLEEIPPPTIQKHKHKREPVRSLPFGETFALVWAKWEKHRIEKKLRLTPTTIDQQLSKLEQMGELRAIAALENSIFNGYQGIFEPKTITPSAPQPALIRKVLT